MASATNRTKQPTRISYVVLIIALAAVLFGSMKLGELVFAPHTAPSSTDGGANTAAQPSGGALVNPPLVVQDFTLTSQKGTPMSLKALQGKVALIFFGYTNCPDECPTTMANYTRVKNLLGADADKVNFVFISVDSKRDTPSRLTEFLNQFDPSFVGLTGADAALHNVAAEFGAYFTIPSEGQSGHAADVAGNNYFVDHTSPSYLIDAKGLLRAVYFYGSPAESLVSGIHQFLAQ